MAQARPVHLRVRELASPGSRPAIPAALTRPGLLEKSLATLTIFLLEFELPDTWFRNADDSITGELNLGGDLEILALFLVLYSLAFSRLLNNGDLVFRLLGRARLLTAFIGWITLSTIWSATPGVTLRRSAALLMTTGFAVYLLVRFSIRQVVGITATAFSIGSILSLFFVLALPGSGVSRSGWVGIFLNKNLLGRHEVLAFLIYVIASALLPRWRSALRCMAVLSVVLVIGSTSATSLVALLATAGNYLVFRLFKARKTLFGAVAVSFIGSGLAAMGIAYANLGALTGLLGKDITFTGRTELWERSLSAVGDRPVFGWGWDAYWRGFFSPSHELWVQMPWLPPHAHNAFIDYLLVIGIPGAVLFLAMFVQAVVRAARYIRDRGSNASLFPMMMLIYGFLFSLTEAGVVGRHVRWVLFVIAILEVSRTRVQPLSPSPEGDGADTPRPLVSAVATGSEPKQRGLGQ